jgi:thioesterase domain-containing protein
LALINEYELPPLRAAAGSSVTPARDKSAVRQTIERVWAEMAPFASHMDESVAWRETGADSLLTLQFLVRLQQSLERPLSFDMFTLDMTVGEIIQAIEDSQAPGSGSKSAKSASADKISLFIIPGIFGDEPILAEFRRSLSDVLQPELLDLADIDRPASLLSSMTATADDLVRQIQEKQPTGPIYVAGYSLGGILAFQVGSDLVKAGRDVQLVCMLDALYGEHKLDPKAGGDDNLSVIPLPIRARLKLREKEPVQIYLERLVFGALLRLRLFDHARRWLVTIAKRHDFAVNYERRRFMISMFRIKAVQEWRPEPSAAPSLLITSDHFEREFSVDEWVRLCPKLTIQHVAGGHHDIFEPAAMAIVKPALLAAIDRNGAAAG